MEKEETAFDKLAKQQKATMALAESAKRLWAEIDSMTPQELVRLFRAICEYPEYDKNLHYRKKVLRVLNDEFLCELQGVRVCVELAWEIERRLWIVERDVPDAPFAGNVDIQDITE
jgi:hypothetical protein